MTTPDVAQALRAARELIAEPERWCQRAIALDEKGRSVNPESPAARRFCLRGALDRACGADVVTWVAAYDALDAAVLERKQVSSVLVAFNDSHSHADVMALFSRAIAAAGAPGEKTTPTQDERPAR